MTCPKYAQDRPKICQSNTQKKVGAKCPLVLQKLGQNVLTTLVTKCWKSIAITKIDSRPKRLFSQNKKTQGFLSLLCGDSKTCFTLSTISKLRRQRSFAYHALAASSQWFLLLKKFSHFKWVYVCLIGSYIFLKQKTYSTWDFFKLSVAQSVSHSFSGFYIINDNQR